MAFWCFHWLIHFCRSELDLFLWRDNGVEKVQLRLASCHQSLSIHKQPHIVISKILVFVKCLPVGVMSGHSSSVQHWTQLSILYIWYIYICMYVSIYCKQDLFKDTSWMCVIVSVRWTWECSSKYLTRDFCVLDVWHWKLSDALAEIE